MIFTSQAIEDPRPWRNRYDGSRWATPGIDQGATHEGAGVLDFEPRGGYSPQEINPVLTAFRLAISYSGKSPSRIARLWLYDGSWRKRTRYERTLEHIEHAQRVLEKLAVLP